MTSVKRTAMDAARELNASDPAPMDSHTGRPVLRPASWGGVLVLCSLGHVLHHMADGEWAGSWLEDKASDPSWRVECFGAVR